MTDIEISVQPHEVVLGERVLQVTATSEDRAMRGAEVSLASARSDVELSEDGRTATIVPRAPLSGPQTLVVGEMVSARGTRVHDRVEVPFFVSDSRAQVDPRLRIQGITRLQIGELSTTPVSAARRPKGAFIELMKTVDRKSGKPVELAFDEAGKPIEAGAIFERMAHARRARFGKLHPALAATVERCKAAEPVRVAVWIDVPAPGLPVKSTRGATKTRPRTEVAHAKRAVAAAHAIAERLREHGAREPEVDPHVPVVYATLPAERVRELEQHDDVAALFLHETEGINDLKDSIAVARADVAQSALGVTGSGVNVAVYEDGPKDTSQLSFTARYDSTPPASDHARLTSAIIKNVESGQPHGYAPDCNLHSANSYDLAALRWATKDHGCTVVSQSFHRDAEQTDSGLSFDDIYKDQLALQWPYPTIVQAAGNGGSGEYVNHKGYNTLTVASHDDGATALASDSVFRNPSSSHGDRELPEIAANGIDVHAVGEAMSGTSFAAPAVAGCVALMQEASSTLKSWPEGCRAALLAAAGRNITGSTWWADRSAGADAHDGAGVLDAAESVRIARNRRGRNSAGGSRGYDVGTLRSADIGADRQTTFSYTITVPRLILSPRVQVALAWDSQVFDFSFFSFDLLTNDLDLMVYDSAGALVGYSGSWDNSYEVVDFAAARGETYTVKIRRWSGSADVWYGIAWTVGGVRLIDPVIVNGGVLHHR